MPSLAPGVGDGAGDATPGDVGPGGVEDAVEDVALEDPEEGAALGEEASAGAAVPADAGVVGLGALVVAESPAEATGPGVLADDVPVSVAVRALEGSLGTLGRPPTGRVGPPGVYPGAIDPPEEADPDNPPP
jgi:hypothetical protein